MAEGDYLAWTVLFGGGADLRSGRGQMPEKHGINYLNVVLDDYGGVMKRPGSNSVQVLGSGTTRVISEFVWYRPSGAAFHMVHLSDGSVWSSPDLTTYTSRLTGMATADPFCFCGAVGTSPSLADKLYFSNNTNGMYVWDGAAANPTLVSGGPAAKYLAWWKDALWAGNVASDRSKVYTSATGNADSWPAVSWVTLGRGDGDEITALWAEPNNLIVGKRRRIFTIINPTTFENRNVDPDKGVESHWSFITSDDGAYFLSRKGVARLQLQAPSEIVSRNIEPFFTQEVMNFSRLGAVWAYKHADAIGWSVPEAGSQAPSIQIEYYPGLPEKPFVFHRGPWRTFSTWRVGSVEKLLAGSTVANKVLEAFAHVGTDDGVAFSGVAESAPINLRKADIIKYLSHVSVVGRGTLAISFKRNYEDVRYKRLMLDLGQLLVDPWNNENWNDGIWGPRGTYSEDILHPDMYFENVVIELRDVQTGTGLDRVAIGDKLYLLGESRRGFWAVHKVDLRCIEMGMVDHESRLLTL
jgi:hypothetical protein